MTELPAAPGEPPPPYIIFLVVFLFFLTGLLGFLVCHLLKKKGYRCRTGDMDEDEEDDKKLAGDADDEDEENQDTVEQILKCIIENEANMEAFNELLGNNKVCVRHDPRLRKESIGGVPPHHHTVHSGTDHNSCHLCAQVRSKKGRRQSRTPRSKQRPGEQTVFSVGRFRVTHTDKKPQGGINPLAASGDQLDQSQDSDDRKEGGYNLRSMFKEPPPGGANGVAGTAGKRRKSVTLFGLRRGSDPVAGPGKEAPGVRFTLQQQPVVLEEPVQAENRKRDQEPKPASELEVNSPSDRSQKLSQNSGPQEAADLDSGPGAPAASGPGSLPVASEKTPEEASDPGPLQTSTPIAPMPGPPPGSIPVEPPIQPGPGSPAGFSVTQTPDQSSSPGLQKAFGASLALISLGSSPPSSFPVQTPSPASLRTPPSPLPGTPSPTLDLRRKPSEPSEPVSSAALTPSPQLLISRSPPSSSSFGQSSSPLQASSPTPALTEPRPASGLTSPSAPADQNLQSSPGLTGKSGSVTSGTSATKGDVDPGSSKDLDSEGTKTTKTEEKTGMKRAGILKTSKLSAAASEQSEGSSSDQLLKDRVDSLLLSPSSPPGGRTSSVTLVRASPDSSREFSVVTTVDEEQTGRRSERGGGAKAALGQEKDDMMEMEDIRDCKVMQLEEEELEEMELQQD